VVVQSRCINEDTLDIEGANPRHPRRMRLELQRSCGLTVQSLAHGQRRSGEIRKTG